MAGPFPSPIVQAPMVACTDLPFRLIAREHGLSFAFAEMVSAQALVRRNPKTLKILQTCPGDRPVGAQILGREPAMMAEAARIVEELGFDLLDINLGCPVRKVIANGEGAAMLGNPRAAESVFSAVRRAVKIPVTVKLRSGIDDPGGAEALTIVRIAQDRGLSAATIHGRTQKQGYAGAADWRIIGRVKSAVSLPIFGNGDVAPDSDLSALRAHSGVDGVMVGRGALGNPWIYGRLESSWRGNSYFPVPSAVERLKALLKHLDLEIEWQGERQAALNMRRIVVWYTAGLPGNKPLRAEVCRTMDLGLIRRMIEDFFAALPSDLPPPAVPLLLAGEG